MPFQAIEMVVSNRIVSLQFKNIDPFETLNRL